MANIFCPNCGFKTTYQFAVPNFCSKCGNPYVRSKLNSTFANKKPNIQIEEDYDENDSDDEFSNSNADDFSDSLFVPRINNLKVELDYSSSEIKSFKFGELFGENVTDQQFPIKKPRNLSDLI